MRSVFLSLLWFAVAATVQAETDYFPPAGKHAAEVLVIGLLPEIAAIENRMKQALAADPEWIKSHLEKHKPKPGELLP